MDLRHLLLIFLPPASYEGHGGNHDFNCSELKDNLKNALELPPYPKTKK